MQDGQQQVLLVDLVGTLYAGLEHGELQYVVCLLIQQEVVHANGHCHLILPQSLLELGLDRLHVEVHTAEDVVDGPLLHAEKPQQQVLGANIAACEPCCLLAGESKYFGYLG